MKNNKRLYIAYGSNLDTEQMAYRCPGAKVVAKSWLHDYRLVFQGSLHGAHANVIPSKGHDVPVLIWEIDQYDEMSLDRYEGVRGGYYTKEYYTIEVNGELKEALIYIMTPRPFGIPMDGYLQIIANGYREFRFPAAILNEAVRHAHKHTRWPRFAAPAAL